MKKIFGWYLLIQGVIGLLMIFVFFLSKGENLGLAAIALLASLLFIWGGRALLRTEKRARRRVVINWDIGGFVFWVLTPIVVSVYVAFRLGASNDGALNKIGPYGAIAAWFVTTGLVLGINWVWRRLSPHKSDDLSPAEEVIEYWTSLDSIDETQPSPEEIAAQAAQVDKETLEYFKRQFSGEEPVRERTPRPHYPSGLSKYEIWSQVAERVGGDLMRTGGWHNHWIKCRYREWDIVLETRSSWFREVNVTWTRMYAAFNNKHGLRFKIKYKGISPAIETMLGAQDIETGDEYFDQIFITKGNNEGKIKELLNDEKLRKLIPRRSGMYFQIRNNEGWLGPKYPKGVDLLFFECNEIKSGPALEALFDLFTGTLERMLEIGSASADAPNIKR